MLRRWLAPDSEHRADSAMAPPVPSHVPHIHCWLEGLVHCRGSGVSIRIAPVGGWGWGWGGGGWPSMGMSMG